ncbi:hypothetical protein [Beijerinckia sp. L45]|uniref:hypothetical protein n=1 Tax=Beijerinckia sp. L45 TaxID=1641855 RepID=UPI00131BE039|nr:hypothetical protein [Beijerinckia sp. L45]
MTRSEIDAFNAGVVAVLDLALRCSQSIELRMVEKPTRFNFASGALLALADEGRVLLMPVPPKPSEGISLTPGPRTPVPHSSAEALAVMP